MRGTVFAIRESNKMDKEREEAVGLRRVSKPVARPS